MVCAEHLENTIIRMIPAIEYGSVLEEGRGMRCGTVSDTVVSHGHSIYN